MLSGFLKDKRIYGSSTSASKAVARKVFRPVQYYDEESRSWEECMVEDVTMHDSHGRLYINKVEVTNWSHDDRDTYLRMLPGDAWELRRWLKYQELAEWTLDPVKDITTNLLQLEQMVVPHVEELRLHVSIVVDEFLMKIRDDEELWDYMISHRQTFDFEEAFGCWFNINF